MMRQELEQIANEQSKQATAARVLEKECKQSEGNGRRNTIMPGSLASRLQTLLLRNKKKLTEKIPML
jgi:hypothetical protein